MKALLEQETRALLEQAGIPVLPGRLAKTPAEAVLAAEALGYPTVLKVVSPDIVHKSEAGGVKLNLRSREEVLQAWAEVTESALRYHPGAQLCGMLVSPQVQDMQEVIVGALWDAQFGPAVMVGLGGVFVEIFKDVAFDLAPVTPAQAERMLRSLKAWPILAGARGKEGISLPALSRLIADVSRFAAEQPVAELDLNPVFCDREKALVGDARLLLREDAPAGRG